MNQNQPAYTLVKGRKHLQHLVTILKNEPEIGVDIEADSLFHYQEKVCLIQISTPFLNILVDPLSLDDISPLATIFADHNIRKVFHGADYDIRSLYRDFKINVNTLFDTHIAARFLGIPETGLAPLLKNKLDVTVDKKYQKKDWSKRPLPPAMLAYAVHDTCHLLPLFKMLKKELLEKKRLSWVEEECDYLSHVRPTLPDDGPFFLKFKNARKLNPRSLAILESILKLRDDWARQKDRPPFKVLGNETIREIAEKRPLKKQELKGIKGLSPGLIEKIGPSILENVTESLSLSEDQLPVFPKKIKSRTSPKVSKGIKILRTWRDQQAKALDMDPAIICTNAQIEAIAQAFSNNPEDLDSIDILRTWQKKLYGKEIYDILINES